MPRAVPFVCWLAGQPTAASARLTNLSLVTSRQPACHSYAGVLHHELKLPRRPWRSTRCHGWPYGRGRTTRGARRPGRVGDTRSESNACADICMGHHVALCSTRMESNRHKGNMVQPETSASSVLRTATARRLRSACTWKPGCTAAHRHSATHAAQRLCARGEHCIYVKLLRVMASVAAWCTCTTGEEHELSSAAMLRGHAA